MRSALYRGTVTHTRLRSFQHSFRYRVYYGLFDIDELDRLDNRLRWFSSGRFNLMGFAVRDHGPADGTPLRPWAERLLAEAGVDLGGGRIEILAHPRVLGHVFDPISVWYCYGPDDELRGILHEVRNTFGHRHTYVVPISDASSLRHRAAKQLHVSPFNEMEQTYDFTVTLPGRRLGIAIEQSRPADGVFFRAGLRLTRLPFADRTILRLFFGHPLLTLKVVSGIHWQALKIWLKGGRYHPVPAPPQTEATIAETIEVTS
jgi:DUF1365 family protein